MKAPIKGPVSMRAHEPHGSGDAGWRIDDADGKCLAIVDPHMEIKDPMAVAEAIVSTLNALPKHKRRNSE